MQKWDLSLTATKRGVFQIEQFECVLKDPFHFIICTFYLYLINLRTEIYLCTLLLKEVAGFARTSATF